MTFKDVAESLTWEEWEQLAAARKGFCRESTKEPGSIVLPGTRCFPMSCSLCGFPPVAVTQNSLREERVYLAFKARSQSITETSQGRNLAAGPLASPHSITSD